jgi:HEAT repeat protein
VTRSIDRQLEDLERLRESLDEPDAIERLRRHLSSRASVVVASAARLVARVPDPGLVLELVAAFQRFMSDPARTDKGCLAKVAVVEALLAAGDPEPELLRSGLRHVQLEPTWGGQTDTAAPLRALCALGLVQVGADGVLDDLAVLLADPDADARLGAARALAACGALATPLLRFKALAGDDQPLVSAECLSGLMSVAPDGSFDFVAALIDPSRPELAANAAMALAESRDPRAYEVLRGKWDDALFPEFRQGLLLPIGLTRHEEAPDFLLSVLESGDLAAGTGAIAALAIYKGHPGVRARAEEAIRGTHRTRLLSFLERAFE